MINDTLIICEGDQYVAIDQNSGGYPYLVDSAWQAKHWRLLKEATAYRDKFPKKNWSIKVFRATALWEVGKVSA